MSRKSEPLLKLLRDLIAQRKLNTAALAQGAGLERTRVRKVLSGSDAMTVDELLAIGSVLDLSPTDFGLLDLPAAPRDVEAESHVPMALAATAVVKEPPLEIDPWGNQPEQLFRVAFSLGCDFFFLARADELEESGAPKHILRQYAGRDLPIKLDAAFHQHNNPRYDEDGVTLTLSFDAIYECRIPWSTIHQVVFFPALVDPPEEDEDEEVGPVLRLVT